MQERFSLPWWQIPADWPPIKQWLLIILLNGVLLLGIAFPLRHRIWLGRIVESAPSTLAICNVASGFTPEEGGEAASAKFSDLLRLLVPLIESRRLMLTDIWELPPSEERQNQYGVKMELSGTYPSAVSCISQLFRISPNIYMDNFSLRMMTRGERAEETLQVAISLFVRETP